MVKRWKGRRQRKEGRIEMQRKKKEGKCREDGRQREARKKGGRKEGLGGRC